MLGLKPIAEKILTGLSEIQAYQIEEDVTRICGRASIESFGFLTNRTLGGRKSLSGGKRPPKSPETLLRMSLAQIGKKVPHEIRAKMAASQRARHAAMTAEQKDKIYAVHRRENMSDERKSNLINRMLAYRHSDESKRKISENWGKTKRPEIRAAA